MVVLVFRVDTDMLLLCQQHCQLAHRVIKV